MILRRIAVAMTLPLLFFVSACGSDAESTGSDETASTENTSTAAPAESDDEYAFGTDQDQIAQAIEEAFASQNGKTRWDGDTLVLSLEGDASGPIAGFTECRVLAELLKAEDKSVIEFSDGQVDCADVLG